jgi:hypothetical protein
VIDKRNAVTNRPEPRSKHMRKPAGRSITQFASNRRSQKITCPRGIGRGGSTVLDQRSERKKLGLLRTALCGSNPRISLIPKAYPTRQA